ncbi:NosR/NirI family protein [Paracoccus sanguinis]|uniref:NosR/NirI family transcriptional regulator, nitrite reductase regulator n=1 Tax=Paracoccus sanguinis TaxID=1545044 RepID=A0A1H2UER2_9RHOB|nr:NosR/NirI family protein [Paracoccus sanguinis]SDW54672.1 NosR/NirI family transcriptional regulator, nitrite reductase regulator [Paracoccus sanguinis]
MPAIPRPAARRCRLSPRTPRAVRPRAGVRAGLGVLVLTLWALGLAMLGAAPLAAAPALAQGAAQVAAQAGSHTGAHGGGEAADPDLAPAVPDPALAAALFGLPQGTLPTLTRIDAPVPGWRAEAQGAVLGLIGSTWELVGSTGYSSRPLDVLVAVTPEGRVAGARLMRHAEPVLTLGISDADIAAYVDGFAGYDTAHPAADGAGLPPVISRATISTGVIRDGILRAARILAGAQGLGAGGIDRVAYAPADWPALEAMGALAHVRVSMAEAAAALPTAAPPITPSDAPWFEMWTGLADTPTVGRNLIGQAALTEAAGALGPGQALLVVLSRGLQSHRGTGWQREGRFARIEITQGDVRLTPAAADYTQLAGLPIAGAPELKERSVFRINADPAAGGIDVTQPFRVTVLTPRAGVGGETLTLPVSAEVTLPAAFRLAAPAPEPPLWQQFWWQKRHQVAVVGAMLGVLGLILFAQEWIVRRHRLWLRLRTGYLLLTLLVLGWWLGAQLSVVQVIAFLHALLLGFRWENFLIAPLIFVLWGAVALGMLFWGRGVFCGWLCPFGALQELLNQAAQRIGIRQIAVPQALHERLWVIKYTLFVALVALSFYSMERALVMAEVEPFKTAISMRFLRAWPFVLYAVALLTAGLFIERFYCRYVCPLGAGLALPAKLKVFDWLKRRPQCGRECRLCETKCTVGAIDPLGRINANECVLCLRCQVIMNDETTCPVLKRRSRGGAPEGGGGGGFKAPPIPPAPPPVRPTQVPSGAHDGAAAPVARAEGDSDQKHAAGGAQPPAFRNQRVTP